MARVDVLLLWQVLGHLFDGPSPPWAGLRAAGPGWRDHSRSLDRLKRAFGGRQGASIAERCKSFCLARFQSPGKEGRTACGWYCGVSSADIATRDAHAHGLLMDQLILCSLLGLIMVKTSKPWKEDDKQRHNRLCHLVGGGMVTREQ